MAMDSKCKAKTGDLQLWPWVSIAELWVLHIISLRQTFDQCLKKILTWVKEIWSRHQIQGSNSWHSTVTLTLSPQGWAMGSAHCPTEVSIWPKFRENPPRGKGDTERTQNSRLKPVTLNCDLVSLHGWAIGSVHHFTEANIWSKLKETPSRGKGDIEWTRNSGLKLATLNCDPVLGSQSPWLSYGSYTSSHRWTFDHCLEKMLPGAKEIQSGHEIPTHVLELWPWLWVGMIELLILHIV